MKLTHDDELLLHRFLDGEMDSAQAVAFEARQISSRCPSSPKPVTSVMAWTPGIPASVGPGVLSLVVDAIISR